MQDLRKNKAGKRKLKKNRKVSLTFFCFSSSFTVPENSLQSIFLSLLLPSFSPCNSNRIKPSKTKRKKDAADSARFVCFFVLSDTALLGSALHTHSFPLTLSLFPSHSLPPSLHIFDFPSLSFIPSTAIDIFVLSFLRNSVSSE